MNDRAARMNFRPRTRRLEGRRHRLPASIALPALLAGSLLAGSLLASCGIAASTVPIPTSAPSSAPVLSAAVTVAAGQVQNALRSVGLTSAIPPLPYRPGESPTLAAAPRMVLQATLPDDETHGYIVLYDFATPGMALAAGREMAAYLASGPGRVQFPTDAVPVLRQVGPTLVFYSWSPSASPDGRAGDVATALGTLGQGIPVVR
jgi:hypothetical protein